MNINKKIMMSKKTQIRPTEVVERIRWKTENDNDPTIKALYSTTLGAIVTQNAAMIIHVDNVNFPKCMYVFDSFRFHQSHLYLLNRYIERFSKSVRAARIYLPFPHDKVEKIVIETCAASRLENGIVHICLSLCKDFPHENPLYIQVLKEDKFSDCHTLVTSSLPSQYGALAQIKSTSHVLTEIFAPEAVSSGTCLLAFLDIYGFVAHTMEYSFLLYTGDGRILVPSFENSCAGITAQRIIELINDFRLNDDYKNRNSFDWLYNHVKSAEFVPSMGPSEIWELSEELFVVGDGKVRVIHRWDDKWIGEHHTESELLKVLRTIMAYDKIYPSYDKSTLTPLPYSFLNVN
jgi:branched-subunit amino acid aminotransferase/4-amino-4-deoxychorismate lyase